MMNLKQGVAIRFLILELHFIVEFRRIQDALFKDSKQTTHGRRSIQRLNTLKF